MKKILVYFLTFFIGIFVAPSIVAKADYRYDEFEQVYSAQSSYVALRSYNGKELGIGNFNNPTDIYVYNGDMFFLLDSGNNRIVVMNEEFRVTKVIDSIMMNGEALDIKNSKGIFVSSEGNIYLSDPVNECIYVLNQNGIILNTITRPDSPIFDENIFFKPKNVVTDSVGTVYVISEDSTQGAFMISSTGEFLGFYGRNEVDVTAEVIYQATLRKFVSEEQRALMSNFIPVEFSNFDIDNEGFIYTVNAYSETPKTAGMIRKLNPLGEDILSNPYRRWGDEGTGADSTYYVDVVADNDGFIYALDNFRGRVFVYDNTGFQIAIFGGEGNKLGCFNNPVAIEVIGDNLIVLDANKKNITVFERTYFGQTLVDGLKLYNQGLVDDSLPYFEELVKMDSNFFYAHLVMSKLYYDMGEYEETMKYAILTSEAKEEYSKAKKMIRNESIREHFTLIFVLVVVILVFTLAASKVIRVKRKLKNQEWLKEV